MRNHQDLTRSASALAPVIRFRHAQSSFPARVQCASFRQHRSAVINSTFRAPVRSGPPRHANSVNRFMFQFIVDTKGARELASRSYHDSPSLLEQVLAFYEEISDICLFLQAKRMDRKHGGP